ncbi:MAG: hypothetical protein M3Q81_02395 [bacterium]|nr:hypothetical protein [bacterium]
MFGVGSTTLRLLLLLVSIFLSILMAYIIAEKNLFDLLFYQKSSLHGYYQDDVSNVATKDKLSFALERRVNDVKFLLSSHESNQVSNKTDEYRVIILGDSITYALGVKTNMRFSNQLEKKLDTIRPTKVYNLSQPGDDVVDHLAKYRLANRYLPADMYIVALYSNDLIEVMDNKYPQQESVYEHLKEKCPGKEFDTRVPWESISGDDLLSQFLLPSFSDEYSNICYYRTVATEIQTTQPTLFYIVNESSDVRACEVNSDISAESGRMISLIMKDTLKEISTSVESFGSGKIDFKAVSLRESHPSIDTHKEYANQLYSEIISNDKWNF